MANMLGEEKQGPEGWLKQIQAMNLIRQMLLISEGELKSWQVAEYTMDMSCESLAIALRLSVSITECLKEIGVSRMEMTNFPHETICGE